MDQTREQQGAVSARAMGSAPDRLAGPGPAAAEEGGSGARPLDEHGPTIPMPPIEDARPWWQRYGSALGRPIVLLWRWLLARFEAPPLTSYLPRKQDVIGERILDALHQVPRAYLPVIARMAAEIEQVHEAYPFAILSTRVHMAVSRACAETGRPVVSLEAVLARTADLSPPSVLRALLDLEDVRIVKLRPPILGEPSASAGLIDELRGAVALVELLRPM